VKSNGCLLDISSLLKGAHTITVIAEGATTHYPLADDRMDEPLGEAIPVRREVSFVRE
jgi:hypothetical protein